MVMAHPAVAHTVDQQAAVADLARRPARELAATVIAQQDDIELMARSLRHRVGSLVSTCITYGATSLAGVVDGMLGEKNNVGPVAINTAIATVSGLVSAAVDDADLGEASAAVARGFGCPPLYLAVRGAVERRKGAQKAAAPVATPPGTAPAPVAAKV